MVGFLLPAFPKNLTTRLFILSTYVILHFYGAQYIYAKWKRSIINNISNNDKEINNEISKLENDIYTLEDLKPNP